VTEAPEFGLGQPVSWETGAWECKGTVISLPKGAHRVYRVLSSSGNMHDVPEVLLQLAVETVSSPS